VRRRGVEGRKLVIIEYEIYIYLRRTREPLQIAKVVGRLLRK
jgi:hypothetical protein